MKLPRKLTVADRDFAVLLKRNRRLAGSGCADWCKQHLIVYWWPGETTVGEVLDTLWHEALELWLLGRDLAFVRLNSKERLFQFSHADLQQASGLFTTVFRAINEANGGEVELTGMFTADDVQ